MDHNFTTYTDPADAYQAALDSGNIRACVAVTANGEYVACSRRTAKKYGWEVLGSLYGDPRAAKRDAE